MAQSKRSFRNISSFDSKRKLPSNSKLALYVAYFILFYSVVTDNQIQSQISSLQIYIQIMQIESKYKVISKKSTNKGQICKALYENKKFVIKRLFYYKMSSIQKQRILDEVNILTSMSSSNIIKYIEYINQRRESTLNIVMQYCPSNIQKQIKAYEKQTKKIQEERIWKWLKDIVLGLQQIHKNKHGVILHRNIKPNSIFIDDHKRAKLGNFGLIRKLQQNQQCSQTILQDCYYMSPQQHMQKKFTQKSDIWSLGCLLFEICTFKTPFRGYNQIQILKKICDAKVEPIGAFYSRQLNRVIQWCLEKDPINRPSVQELLSIPQIILKIRQNRVYEWVNRLKAKQQSNLGLQEEIKELKRQIQTLKVQKQSKRFKQNETHFRSLNYETSLKKMMTIDMKRGISQNLDRIQSKLRLGAQSNVSDRFFANKKLNKVEKPAQTYRHLNF